MKKYVFVILFMIILPDKQIFAQPFQFIKYESATLIRKGKTEIKLNGVYEIGQIPTDAIYFQVRYCLFKNFEISANTIYTRFREKDETRFASVNINAKIRLKFMDFGGLKFVNYIKYRIALGDRYTETYTGEYDEVLSVVSKLKNN